MKRRAKPTSCFRMEPGNDLRRFINKCADHANVVWKAVFSVTAEKYFSVSSLSSSGTEFQTAGPATENARRPVTSPADPTLAHTRSVDHAAEI